MLWVCTVEEAALAMVYIRHAYFEGKHLSSIAPQRLTQGLREERVKVRDGCVSVCLCG